MRMLEKYALSSRLLMLKNRVSGRRHSRFSSPRRAIDHAIAGDFHLVGVVGEQLVINGEVQNHKAGTGLAVGQFAEVLTLGDAGQPVVSEVVAVAVHERLELKIGIGERSRRAEMLGRYEFVYENSV